MGFPNITGASKESEEYSQLYLKMLRAVLHRGVHIGGFQNYQLTAI